MKPGYVKLTSDASISAARRMLAAGFSPAPDVAAAGPDALKAALAAFQQKAAAE